MSKADLVASINARVFGGTPFLNTMPMETREDRELRLNQEFAEWALQRAEPRPGPFWAAPLWEVAWKVLRLREGADEAEREGGLWRPENMVE